MKSRHLIITLFCICATLVWGNSPEKLYLHIDRTYYMAGETLWFKGYLVNADNRDETPESNFIYVELLKDTVIQRVKIKRDYLGFSGYIALPASLPSGSYLLRAYTRWQMNWPVENMFHEKIQISQSGKQRDDNRFYNLPDNSSQSTDSSSEETDTITPSQPNHLPANCSVVFNKASYGKRDKIAAQISLVNEKGEPLEGEFSISVVRGIFKDYQQQSNIQSYMNLWESPAMNFIHSSSTDNTVLLQREYTQSITGGIYNKRARKIIQHNINFVSISNQYASTAILGTGDFITLNNLDFPDSTKFSAIYQPTGGDRFRWVKDTFAVWNKESMQLLLAEAGAADLKEDNNDKSIGIQSDRKQIPPRKHLPHDVFMQNDVETDTLKALTVSAHKESAYVKVSAPNLSPLGQQVFDKHSVMERKDIEKYNNLSVLDYIVSYRNFGYRGSDTSGSIAIFSRSQGTLGEHIQPKLYIDGIRQESTGVLSTMLMYDVETIVLLKGIEGALYNTVNGVILIELRSARNLKYTPGANRNNQSITPLGYQRPGYFITPVYNTPLKKRSTIPDRRNTIYWNPSLTVYPDGKTYITFYASDDISAPYFIRIEGITQDKQPFSWDGEIYVGD